jgi:hypothetical protein
MTASTDRPGRLLHYKAALVRDNQGFTARLPGNSGGCARTAVTGVRLSLG